MKKEEYIKQVLKTTYLKPSTKQRIKEDLNERIDAAIDTDPYFDIVLELGEPEVLAKELMENFEEEVPSELSIGFTGAKSNRAFEYKTEKTLFGLPLVHVNTGGPYGSAVAKGIVAIGDVSIGVLSLGGVSVGLVSFGGVSIGLAAALGGVAIGSVAVGGVAVGLVAVGGVAIGLLKAIGGFGLLL